MNTPERLHPLQYACYHARSRAGEQFIPDHAIGLVISGSFVVNDGLETQVFREGELYFCRRNHLSKYDKRPPENGEFRSVAVFFTEEMLRRYSLELGYQPAGHSNAGTFTRLPSPSVLGNYMASLRAYEGLLSQPGTSELLALKQKEALLLLLQAAPELKNVLFDFSDPGKIDLEAFMNKHYQFNVELKRFAYLTGRSLSTFKRDFEKIFHQTPGRWLLHKRLEEAHYMIREQHRSASDVYLDVGFEDLSHFSFAFKKQFGVAPSVAAD
ncbi:helix-turn-helix domain-containing protein [Dyadobacter sandarakinus]|uniref:Helix-turn-helix transcriptional regulator n=1 Tax=Dyadobacter sandarakinus TaxID=2747268 RepID=A0ABX7I463_9BACT|nr:AraC family transcriptional regulator [Dyadobacter sandarakinus]QRR00565.1 helix-turn-helix transcriptional regulator [Dyadobacter sandarakinus]